MKKNFFLLGRHLFSTCLFYSFHFCTFKFIIKWRNTYTYKRCITYIHIQEIYTRDVYERNMQEMYAREICERNILEKYAREIYERNMREKDEKIPQAKKNFLIYFVTKENYERMYMGGHFVFRKGRIK